jgi:phospholipid/cholesterol/gamma-HCH transport system substrate-binding protein
VDRFSLLAERMRNTPGLRNDLVVLVVLLILGSISGGYIVSKYDIRLPGADRYTFSADFDMAPAVQLASRQEVRVAGLPVGKITGAKPTSDGKARVTMTIDPDQKVYSNARLVIRSKTPLNVMYVTLNPGGPPSKPLPADGTIPVTQTDRVLQPFELLDELDSRAREAITSLVNQADIALADAPAQLPAGLKATNATVASLQPVVEQLQERRANIARLVTAVSQISTAAGKDNERLATLAASLHQTLAVVAKRDNELSAALAQLPGVTDTLRTSLASTAELTSELNPALRDIDAATKKLPGTLSKLGDTVGEAGKVVDKARPVLAKARPVVRDLRPLAVDLDTSLRTLKPVTGNLPTATKRLVPWLDNLAAFVYQTSSAFSLADANGGLGRAQLGLDLKNPLGGGAE